MRPRGRTGIEAAAADPGLLGGRRIGLLTNFAGLFSAGAVEAVADVYGEDVLLYPRG